ncbi:hypothetical protein ANCCEY_09293 [Ancylostoma ceylanicum]|uniref:Kinesin motor domain-containing protein n=1 Tax=Ancylostoma ceylanicum TaxID=53326 RepID=A0A0D6LNK1_9BILA|nr:hypothetical protein ANCCEY_09293 [Ancylostoma ceylanicum]
MGTGNTVVNGLKYYEINDRDDYLSTILGAFRHAALHLVDLAGSERVKESGAEGDRFKEMTYINSALSNLQNCIRSQLNKVLSYHY